MGIFDFLSKQKPVDREVLDPLLKESLLLAKEATAAVAVFERESADLIRELEAAGRVIEEYKKQEERLIKEVYRLRADLKKRTDQYNDLVDLAREKGILGE